MPLKRRLLTNIIPGEQRGRLRTSAVVPLPWCQPLLVSRLITTVWCLTTLQGQPYSVSGLGDHLALFRCVSCKYRFATTQECGALHMGAVGRVYASGGFVDEAWLGPEAVTQGSPASHLAAA